MQLQPLCTSELSVKSHDGEHIAHPIRCKRWSCEVCAKINRDRVIAIARRSKPRALLTLTVNSNDYETPDHAAKALKNGLRLLRLRLKRHEKLKNFQFLAVFERHKSGFPHLHLLIKGEYLPWRWLRSVWEDITGSFMVDIRKINSTGMAALYCAKYIGKDLAAFKHCKRWWRSHGYSDDAEPDYTPNWQGSPPTRFYADINKLRFTLLFEGMKLEREGREGFRWRPPPNNPFGVRDYIAFSEGRTSASLLASPTFRRGSKS